MICTSTLSKFSEALNILSHESSSSPANNDMAGEEEDSWLSMFNASGSFDSVEVQVIGLGSIEDIQKLYVEHTAKVMSE